MKINFNEYLNDWGYANISDLLQTTLHVKQIKPIVAMSFSLGSISAFVDKFLGLELATYMAFFLLLCVEFITGVSASRKEGEKFQSKKFNRFLMKIAIYSLMIGIINTFKISFANDKMGSVYDFIYWTILHIITIHLIISVFENLSRMGFQESSVLFKRLNKFLSKWFDLVESKEDKKEEEKI